MIALLQNPTFRHLFAAQVVALIGTGLATVALGLLAWDLAGANAGAVMGTALAIKMVAYVTLSPLVAAVAERLPRRAFLVALDLIRAVVIGFLPFVDQVWQVYVLIFVLQAASAGFTPAFQAVIPDVMKTEEAEVVRSGYLDSRVNRSEAGDLAFRQESVYKDPFLGHLTSNMRLNLPHFKSF